MKNRFAEPGNQVFTLVSNLIPEYGDLLCGFKSLYPPPKKTSQIIGRSFSFPWDIPLARLDAENQIHMSMAFAAVSSYVSRQPGQWLAPPFYSGSLFAVLTIVWLALSYRKYFSNGEGK